MDVACGDGRSLADCGAYAGCVFEMRLLNAGQPLHPAWPPVPLHRPPPGQVPDDVWSVGTDGAGDLPFKADGD